MWGLLKPPGWEANTAWVSLGCWGCARSPWHCQGQFWLLPSSNSSSFSFKVQIFPLVSPQRGIWPLQCCVCWHRGKGGVFEGFNLRVPCGWTRRCFSFGRDKRAEPDPLAWSCSFCTDGIKTSWEKSRQCHSSLERAALGRTMLWGTALGQHPALSLFLGFCLCPGLWGKDQEHLTEISP